MCLNMSEHVSRYLVQSYFTNETVLQNIVKFNAKMMQIVVSEYVSRHNVQLYSTNELVLRNIVKFM